MRLLRTRYSNKYTTAANPSGCSTLNSNGNDDDGNDDDDNEDDDDDDT